MNTPTPEEIAWAAGLFEGEGCIMATGKNSAKLSIEMTDLDVLQSFHRIVDAGAICDKTRLNPEPQWKLRWVLQIYKASDVERILRWFLPLLHRRRREKAEAMLARLANNRGPRAERTHCPSGHPWIESNIYRWPRKPHQRKCRTCHRINANRRYHRLKGVMS